MNIGMLWFDNDPKTEISAKIERAAAYYHNKYGKAPNLCFVHPSMLGQAAASNNGKSALHSGVVVVRPSASIRPNHFWIGVDGTVIPTES